MSREKIKGIMKRDKMIKMKRKLKWKMILRKIIKRMIKSRSKKKKMRMKIKLKKKIFKMNTTRSSSLKWNISCSKIQTVKILIMKMRMRKIKKNIRKLTLSLSKRKLRKNHSCRPKKICHRIQGSMMVKKTKNRSNNKRINHYWRRKNKKMKDPIWKLNKYLTKTM